MDIGALQTSNALDIGPIQNTGAAVITISGTVGTPSQYAVGCPGAANVNGNISVFGCSGGTASAYAGGIGGALAVTPDIVGAVGKPSAYAAGVGGTLVSDPGIVGSYGTVSQYQAGYGGALLSSTFALFIGGADKVAVLQVGSLNVSNPLSQSSTGSFELFDKTGVYHAQTGQEVLMYHLGVRVYGGTIDEITETAFPGLPGVYSQITLADFSNILDRRIINEFFAGGVSAFTPRLVDIVGRIVSVYLVDDGISYDATDSTGGLPFVAIGPQTFFGQTPRQIFNTLSNLTGWDYSVDYFKVLRFFPRSTGRGNAPFNIADGDSHVLSDVAAAHGGSTSISIRKFRGTYRNRQYVRSSSASSATWSDTFSVAHPGPFPNSPQPPDGIRFFFVTLYGIIATPSVTVNGVGQRVISFLDIGTAPAGSWDWYWIPQQGAPNPSPGVGQNPSNPVLTSADTLVVNYATNIPPLISVDCNAQIVIRAAIEGNSGIYADIQDVPNITDPVALATYAQGLLDRYGCLDGIPSQVMYSTDTPGLFAGMLQTIQRTRPLIASSQRQISLVTFRDIDGAFLRYQITADSGRFQANDSSQFFAQLVSAAQLPQPANRMVYNWQIAPSYAGITNPGAGGGVQLQVRVITNPWEVFQYLVVSFNDTPTSDGTINIFENGNTTGSFVYPKGQTSPMVFYYGSSNTKFAAGTQLQVFLGGGFAGMKDGDVSLVTSVIVSA